MVEQHRRYRGTRKARVLGTLAAVAAGALAAVAVPAGEASAATASGQAQAVSYTTAGEHAFTVPFGVTSVHVVAIGGRGGGGYVPGGLGARVEANLRVVPGSTIYAEVGGNGAPTDQNMNESAAGGANGGNPGGAWTSNSGAQQQGVPAVSGAGGGGASDVQNCPVASCKAIGTGSSARLLLVAAGGGGAGWDSQGGNGGTPVGGSAAPLSPAAGYGSYGIGFGATQTAAGTNSIDEAAYGPQAHCSGDAGDSFGGGGGGGGYYCGGGGASVYGLAAGGGGGGSSYGPAGTSYSVAAQDPSVTITPNPFLLAPASRSSLALDGAGTFVTQQVPSGASSQLWQLVPQGSLYQIVNAATGQCLTTFGYSGDQLFTYTCGASPYNLWQLPANFGTSATGSMIWNPAFNLFVTVSGGSTAPGAAVDSSAYDGSAGQYFLPFPG